MNWIQRKFSGITRKHSSPSIPLTSTDTTWFASFAGIFGFSFNNDGKQFKKYIEAFRTNQLV